MNKEEALACFMNELKLNVLDEKPSGDALLRPYFNAFKEGSLAETDYLLWRALSRISYRGNVVFDDESCKEALGFVLSRPKTQGDELVETEIDISDFNVLLDEVLEHPNFPTEMVLYRVLLRLFRHLLEPRSQCVFKSYSDDVIGVLDQKATQGAIEGPARWALLNAVLMHKKRGQKHIVSDLSRWYESLPQSSLATMRVIVDGALLLNKDKPVQALWLKCAANLEVCLDGQPDKNNPDPEDHDYERLIRLYQKLNDHGSTERAWKKRLARLSKSVELTVQEYGAQFALGFQGRLVKHYKYLMTWRDRQGDYQNQLKQAEETLRELTCRFMADSPTIMTEIRIPVEDVNNWLDSLWEGVDDPWVKLIRLSENVAFSRQDVLSAGMEEDLQPIASRIFGSQMVATNGRMVRSYTQDEAHLLSGSRTMQCKLQLYVGAFVAEAWRRVLSEQLASPDDLMGLYKGLGLVSDNRIEALRYGLVALFEERYVDAVHLLIPQFEASLRCLYHRVTLGGVRANSKDQGQHETLLNTMLEGDDALGHSQFEHPSHWQNYAYTWSFIFGLEGFGFNLRNDVCHGLWSNDHNPAADAYLILVAMMLLARCAIEANEWQKERQDKSS